MAASYDVIVVGLGGMGSATAYHLAKDGRRVLGLDMHPRGHTFGSSHGHHRIIREAYFEGPGYVPIVQHAYELWRELEEESGRANLLTITGGLMIGLPESDVVSGALRSAEAYDLPHERYTASELAEQYPGFQFPEDYVAVYEGNAGFVQPEDSVAAHLDLAASHGAELKFSEEVTGWSADGEGVRVETPDGSYTADALVVTTGPWASELLADLNIPLTVRRVVNAHFESARPDLFSADHSPIYIFQVPEGWYYGFPYIPGLGVKIGRHDIGETVTARTIRRDIDDEEIDLLRHVLDSYLPGASGPILSALTCMYTMTPDEDFVIDRHPEHPNVVLGCGFSGHGYKFAAAIGQILADLATDTAPAFDIDFLSLGRFRG